MKPLFNKLFKHLLKTYPYRRWAAERSSTKDLTEKYYSLGFNPKVTYRVRLSFLELMILMLWISLTAWLPLTEFLSFGIGPSSIS